MNEQRPHTDVQDVVTSRRGVTLCGTRYRWVAATGAGILLALCAGISVLTVRLTQPETVAFDMKGTIDRFIEQSAHLQMDKPRSEALMKRFSTALDSSLAQWQQAHNGIILVSGAIVRPAQDITPEIRADVARRMQEGP